MTPTELRAAVEAHTRACRQAMAKMQPRPECPAEVRANLAGANLAGAYLAGADLAGAYLAGADLAGAYLAGAYLARAYLAGANLAGAYLTDADLTDADLAGAYLAGAYLAGANLAGAYLAGADLTDADLTGADLTDAKLTGAKLTGAKILAHVQVGPLGSRRAPLLIARLDDGRLWCVTGCFAGDGAAFLAAVAKTHADGAHGRAYRAAVQFAETLMPAPAAVTQ